MLNANDCSTWPVRKYFFFVLYYTFMLYSYYQHVILLSETVFFCYLKFNVNFLGQTRTVAVF